MTDTQIREALARATGHVSAAPDLLERVRAGGRRRVVRRRAVLAGGLAVAVAGSAAGTWALSGGDGEAPVASPLLDGATRGDLRGDTAYLKQVRDLLRRTLGNHLAARGEPHVAWAGTTPAGPVAVVTQRLREQVVSDVGQLQYGMIAFVQPTAAGPRITSSETMVTGTVNAPAVLVGAKRDVLVVLDDGRRVQLSEDFTYAPDGKVRRTFAPLKFTADGAAVVQLAAQDDRIRIALKPGSAGADPNVSLANLSDFPWPDQPQRLTFAFRKGVAAAAAPDIRGWPDLDGEDGYGDRWGVHRFAPKPSWYLYGTTPGGRKFVVQTLTLDDGRPRLFQLDADGKPHFLGFTDPGSPLAVQAPLPAGGGLVVAVERGALRYRAGAGSWLPVKGSVALLPPAASEVEVTPPGGQPVTVRLPG